jgi:hypothetical protein
MNNGGRSGSSKSGNCRTRLQQKFDKEFDRSSNERWRESDRRNYKKFETV